MKFPAPKTLHGSFSPLIYTNIIFGIGVIRYPVDKPRPIISAIWSMINFLIYLSFVRMANLSEMPRLGGSSVVTSNYRNYIYINTAFIIVSHCISHTQTKVVGKSFMQLNNINDRLKRLNIPDDYDINFKAQVIYFSVSFAFMIFVMVLDFMYMWRENLDQFARVFFLICAHYCLTFCFMIDSGCSTTMRYFTNRFKRLNWLLEEPNLHKTYETRFNREPNDRDIHFNTLTLEEIHEDPASNRIANNRGIFYIVRESRKIHRDLCTTATKLNGAFGIQLLFSLGLSLGMLTSLLYNCYVIAIAGLRSRQFDDVITDLVPPLWAVFYCLKIFIIIITSANTSDEAKRTGQLIHTLLNSTIIYNKEVRDELKIFSIQLMQNPLQLTAFGFFILDKELACSIFGTATTFVIIMIQMRSIYES